MPNKTTITKNDRPTWINNLDYYAAIGSLAVAIYTIWWLKFKK